MKSIGIAFLIGFACGLRSLSPPAAIAWTQHLGWLSAAPPLSKLGSRRGVAVLSTMAAMELVVDKLPSTPSRLERRGLAFRMTAGALTGASTASDSRLGAVAGLAGALVGSFAGAEARSRLTTVALEKASERGIHAGAARFAVALVEDAACIKGSLLLLLILRKSRRAA